MGSLGDVLDFTWPGLFGDLIAMVKPIFEWWTFVFAFIGPGECYGLRSYPALWTLKVFGMFAVLSTLVALNYLYDVRQEKRSSARDRNPERLSPVAKALSSASVAVFLLYPGTCQLAFEVFLCRKISTNEEVFELDDRVLRSSGSHQVMKYLA
jgi:hypothetical protein